MQFKHFLLFLLVILVPLLVGAYVPQTVDTGRSISYSMIEPILNGVHLAGSWVEAQKELAVDLFRARHENQILRKNVRQLEQKILSLKEVKQENLRIKELLGFQQSSEWKTISAQVIGRDLSHWTFYIIINKGRGDGINENMPVVTGQGLIGKVISVSARSARVILLIDPEARASALVQETRDIGLIEGTGRPFLNIIYLDFHADIKVGHTVVSSGLGGIYPKGIPIGEIIQIGEDTQHLSMTALVKPFASFSKLEEVLCLIVEDNSQP